MCHLIDLYTFMFTTVVAIREEIVQNAVRETKVSITVVYIMENIFSYGPNLTFEIGGNGSHFKNVLHYLYYNYAKMPCFYHILNYKSLGLLVCYHIDVYTNIGT